MKKRKLNRLKGYDYSQNNLYFVTNCVKNNRCCFGRVVRTGRLRTGRVRTGRDLSVSDADNHHHDYHHTEKSNSDLDFHVELNQYGLIVDEKIKWLAIQYPYVVIHNYVVMPNHFHVIIEIDRQLVKGKDIKIKSLSSLMGALKTTTSKQIHMSGFEDFAWHRSFHDHIIRNDISYQNILNYIDLNPQKWLEDCFYSGT